MDNVDTRTAVVIDMAIRGPAGRRTADAQPPPACAPRLGTRPPAQRQYDAPTSNTAACTAGVVRARNAKPPTDYPRNTTPPDRKKMELVYKEIGELIAQRLGLTNAGCPS